jgi:hypothetical protein
MLLINIYIQDEALNNQQVPSSENGMASAGKSFDAFSGQGRSLSGSSSNATSSSSKSWFNLSTTGSQPSSSRPSTLRANESSGDDDSESLVTPDRDRILRATQSRLKNRVD